MSNLQAAKDALQRKNTAPPPEPEPEPIPTVQINSRTGVRDALRISLKEERNKLGWSQRKLAAKAGLSQGTITRAERHMWISIGCLIRIVDALGKKLTLT